MTVSLDEMKAFLGEDGDYSNTVIVDLISSAEEDIEISTGVVLETTPYINTVKKLVKLMVWLSFYADRDAAKNTEYLKNERTRLIKQLQAGVIVAET